MSDASPRRCSSRPAERAEITLQTKAGIVPGRPVLRLLLRAPDRLGRGVAASTADRLHRHPAAAPAGCAGRAGRGGARVRRARSRRQGPCVRSVQPDATADRPAEEVGDPADRGQPAAAVDHPRTDRRAGGRDEHGRAWTSPSPPTAAASSTTAACTTSPCRPGRRSRRASSPACSSARRDYPELNQVIDRLAAEYDVPPIAIATAWITRHPARMQVVLGTTTPERVIGAAAGSDIPLTRAEWYELFRAAGYRVP